MKKLIKVAVVAGLAAMSIAACGRGHRHDPERMTKFVNHKVDDVLDDLEATEAQRAQVLPIKDQLLADGLAFRAQNKQALEALFQILSNQAPDAAAAHGLIDQRVDALRTQGHKMVDAALKVHGVLTPEQRQKLVAKLERFRDRHHD